MRTMRWTAAVAALLAMGAAPGEAAAQMVGDTGLVLAAAAAALERRMEPIENLSLQVSLSERTLSLMSGDRVVRQYPVSVGKSSHPTPTGTFRVNRLIWNPSWHPPASAWARDRRPQAAGSPGNPMGRVKIFFREPDYYLHGTGHASSLGEALSHGCVRLRNADAAEVARYVMMAGRSDRSPEWFQQVSRQRTTSRSVSLQRPVVMRIVR
jgi:lipoprotein-anchoring transpeptidase ErfK/SrfK